MAKSPKALVIVESPAKVKTINKILGDQYKVVSSMGHVIDLPKSTLGIDIEHDFKPKLIVIRTKQQTLKKLKAEAKSKKEIYIATDPDREGEAIGWNLAQEISEGKKLYRVVFHEITKEAVLKAFKNVREFDKKKIDAQTARRVLDRLVGYHLSPLLWKKVGSGLSAGRVQSVALRLIVERDREIAAFIPQEYWEITADLKRKDGADVITASLEKVEQKKPEITSQAQAQELVDRIHQRSFQISDVTEKEVRRNPAPPFITSTLQQEAFNKLGFNTARTMMIAQELYEGVDLGDGETVGLITYMRTDSVNIADEAKKRVRDYIGQTFSSEYLPATPNVYKSKKSAQEAHEAIRPSDVFRKPQDIKSFLTEDQYKIYELIWRRFVSCQMMPAVFLQKRILITAGEFNFSASASTLKFDGYLALDCGSEEKEKQIDLSKFQKEDILELVKIDPSQHFTKPPPRYSEATLVRALEEGGIGRPSTYAPIIHTLVFRNYVVRDKGYLSSTELGQKICDLLIEYFPKVMNVNFTATMEDHLDLIEEGDLEYLKLIQEFYPPFKEELDYAMATIEKTTMLTDRQCPDCGRPLAVKWGRRGKFLSCSGFPECRHSQSFATGVKCPEQGCGGEIVERRSKRGTTFYGCSRYPDCNYTARQLPKAI
ncbi:MAG TPA: type I DNA topoisomerase [Candidatus Omnitrophota bacterium]|nr:type I DNA topoisomerase [Candidatus Omnitrophota bacterium]